MHRSPQKFIKDRFYLNQKVLSTLQECLLALLDAEPLFQFWFNLHSFLGIFESGIAPRYIFNSYSKKLIPFS